MASPPTEHLRIGGAISRFSWKTSLAVLVILGLTGWSGAGTEFDLVELLASTRPVEKFVSGMFPPDLSAVTLRQTVIGVVETFQMSFLGALTGAIVAFPLAALGTREATTISASRGERLLRAVPYQLSRFVLNVFRSVPDILWALVFVVALGLGPFPGTLALAVHSAGILGKLYSEMLEAVPPDQSKRCGQRGQAPSRPSSSGGCRRPLAVSLRSRSTSGSATSARRPSWASSGQAVSGNRF